LSYKQNDTIYISTNAHEDGVAYVKKQDLFNSMIDTLLISKYEQEYTYSQSEFGCNWSVTDTLQLNMSYSPGYYQIDFISSVDTSSTYFIIENHSDSKIAVLAPVSTWVAYNEWGGKSLYTNKIEEENVYYVSSQRPFSDPINLAESNIANFFIDNYDATLLPDYSLEYDLNKLASYDIIILAYHAEYFSEKMYDNLHELIQSKHKSLISLGANQVYWKTKWNDDYSIMECRKDLTSFSSSFADYGGMWRHHFFKSEHNLLGVRYSRPGIHSFAPYEIKAPTHWIFENLNVKNEQIFGFTGINNLPISGDETDKIVSKINNMTLLAKGLNCVEKKGDYISIESYCDENSGADFVIIENELNNILSTGSIESGAGLGIDSVFTGMITNFIKRNSKK